MRFLLLLLSLLPSSEDPTRVRPPAQPPTGPGGFAAPHASIEKTVYGAGGDEYWLFEPREPRPEGPVPLIVFLHGWSVRDPSVYGAWIDHLVRRGNAVCFPVYQESLTTLPHHFLPNTITAVRDAVQHLNGDWHVAFDPERVAFVGHSMGGLLSVNLAACVRREGLPQPKLIFAVQPGVSQTLFGELQPLLGPERIHASTILATVVGDCDRIVGDRDALRILLETTTIPASRKALFRLRSDLYGRPRLRAHHLAPYAYDLRLAPNAAYEGAPRRKDVDALDYYGLWRPLDELLNRSFAGAAATASPFEGFDLGMGSWSDGTPVKPLLRFEAEAGVR